MAVSSATIDLFYRKLFTETPNWSTPFPNHDEARRWGKICEYLSEIPQPLIHGVRQRLRILDVGCGRGWLTRLASVYGQCDGVDPVSSSIELARAYFPGLTFHVGTVADLLRSPGFQPYDVVMTSEVIEHVEDKEAFVSNLVTCLVPAGHVILTTPRGEMFRQWLRLGYEPQPVEAWISERKLRALFARHRAVPIKQDRVYLDLPGMSFLHRLCASRKVALALQAAGLTCVGKALQHLAGFYQVWWFQVQASDS